jgi:hypothetical protein
MVETIAQRASGGRTILRKPKRRSRFSCSQLSYSTSLHSFDNPSFPPPFGNGTKLRPTSF